MMQYPQGIYLLCSHFAQCFSLPIMLILMPAYSAQPYPKQGVRAGILRSRHHHKWIFALCEMCFTKPYFVHSVLFQYNIAKLTVHTFLLLINIIIMVC